jgi:hypothetical protein
LNRPRTSIAAPGRPSFQAVQPVDPRKLLGARRGDSDFKSIGKVVQPAFDQGLEIISKKAPTYTSRVFTGEIGIVMPQNLRGFHLDERIREFDIIPPQDGDPNGQGGLTDERCLRNRTNSV